MAGCQVKLFDLNFVRADLVNTLAIFRTYGWLPQSANVDDLCGMFNAAFYDMSVHETGLVQACADIGTMRAADSRAVEEMLVLMPRELSMDLPVEKLIASLDAEQRCTLLKTLLLAKALLLSDSQPKKHDTVANRTTAAFHGWLQRHPRFAAIVIFLMLAMSLGKKTFQLLMPVVRRVLIGIGSKISMQKATSAAKMIWNIVGSKLRS
eukprot:TRINITY_DN1432_c0_g3_i5.p2 TRINITY_DN1432_c0_g3~~TRINITY_DN1432_c0_g3_i5.p2  ORF type:complete len:208 (-),score=19.31 TRINITY_DN1432_c0_g3_i5:241-864(-)